MKYNNPIISGYYPDPSICRVGEWFYLVTSTFEYFPGVPVFKSKDLINWEQIGHCLTRASQLNLDKARKSGGIFAPTIRHHKGRFYMVTTNVTDGGNFYVYTDDIEGEWSEPIWTAIGGIDPTLFFDPSGKTYIVTNEGTDATFGHIVLAEIEIETGKLLSETRELWQGTGGIFIEAPHIYLKDGWYYLMVAEGGTSYGHMETIARSKSIWGPFESCPHNPILTHKNHCSNPIQATGHADIVEDAMGQWWMVFLGIRPKAGEYHHLGRETFLAPVTWNEVGWPVVNGGNPVQLEMDVPQLPATHDLQVEALRDEFQEKTFYHYWNFLRNPNEANYKVDESTGKLLLTGTEITLNDVDTPTFIGRRQQHFECVGTTALYCDTMVDGDEAGLTVFYGDEHHYEIAMVQECGIRYIKVKRSVADMFMMAACEVLPEGLGTSKQPLILSIKAEDLTYHLGWGISESSVNYIACGRTNLLSSEVALGKFTGTYFGLYGISKMSSVFSFDFFDYRV